METKFIVMALVGSGPANLRGTPERVASADTKEAAEKLAADWSAAHGGETWITTWTAEDASKLEAALRPNNGRRAPRRMTAEEVARFNA